MKGLRSASPAGMPAVEPSGLLTRDHSQLTMSAPLGS